MATSSNPNLYGIHVLVVDDNSDNTEMFKVYLESCNAEVVAAKSASEALAVLKGDRPHVIVSDLTMPDMDGLSFVHHLRSMTNKETAKIPAIAVSGHVSPDVRDRVLASGFQGFMAKPCDPEKLAIAIQALLGR